MSVEPQGEHVRKAVKFVSAERKYSTEKTVKQLVDEACLKFDLSPKEAGYVTRFLLENAV